MVAGMQEAAETRSENETERGESEMQGTVIVAVEEEAITQSRRITITIMDSAVEEEG